MSTLAKASENLNSVWDCSKVSDLNCAMFQFILASGSSTVVEQSPHHPKVEGLSSVTTTGTGREKKTEKNVLCFKLS